MMWENESGESVLPLPALVRRSSKSVGGCGGATSSARAERVGVRGNLNNRAFGKSPSPAAHLTMCCDLSPQAGRGEEAPASCAIVLFQFRDHRTRRAPHHQLGMSTVALVEADIAGFVLVHDRLAVRLGRLQ